MKNYNKKICVIGLGYIGLPTAALLASKGNKIIGVDINQKTVDIINSGGVHIVEPGLDQFVSNAISSGLLRAHIKPKVADIYIICVPTPFNTSKGDPIPNLDYVIEAANSIIALVKPGDMIILESTSPVGTTKKLEELLLKNNVDINEIAIAYCPERVLPGNIMSELVLNDRIVGGINKFSTDKVAGFYENFIDGEVLKCSASAAEMCKLAENSYRDVNIAFANEISMICNTHKIDAWELISLANRHPRVNILQPSTGVGGHCIAVDPWFIVSGDPANACIIKTARQVNNRKPEWVTKMIMDRVNILIENGIKNPSVSCLGLAFKPDIDDLRESPAVIVVDKLIQSGLDVKVVEPNISYHQQYSLVKFEDGLKSDLVVVLVKHKEFYSIGNKEELNNINALDFCGVMN